MSKTDDKNIVLASASRSRAALLEAAGLKIEILAANLDETKIKMESRSANITIDNTAMLLARSKAYKISLQRNHAIVIGADQMLVCGDQWFDKPLNREEAMKTLKLLRGRTHKLVTCVSIVRSGEEQWNYSEQAMLTMRSFSDQFLEKYLMLLGDEALQSVGAYQLEGVGAQLFERIEGNYFTILGLPLLPLFSYMRSNGLLEI